MQPDNTTTTLLTATVTVGSGDDPSNRTPFALLDVGRQRRTGIAEAIYAPGKTPTQCVDAACALLDAGVRPVLVTRCDAHQHAALVEHLPPANGDQTTMAWATAQPTGRQVTVVTAGTADQRVAAECAITLAALGHTVHRVADVGVAGLHRLLERADALRAADALVVIAGMEGALATAIAGLVDTPLVAVPTSTGYGSSLDGVTALLSMTASCAPGVSVVGIDNGFGAACVVTRWLRTRERVTA